MSTATNCKEFVLVYGEKDEAKSDKDHRGESDHDTV